jgi:hypothetical protein
MLRWLRRLLLGHPHPRPGFRFECLSDGYWLCRICQRRVLDAQMGFHARTHHGWSAPEVKITAAHTH